jgi:hypothetical protein
MNWTLDEIFQTVAQPRTRRRKKVRADSVENGCRCGMNPLETYFACLEVALSESIAKEFPPAGNHEFMDPELMIADVKSALALVRAREVIQFCSVCQHNFSTSKKDRLEGSVILPST